MTIWGSIAARLGGAAVIVALTGLGCGGGGPGQPAVELCDNGGDDDGDGRGRLRPESA